MEPELLGAVGKIAGIGGIALGVFLLLFRDIIRKNVFPTLTRQDAYRLLRLVSILVWTVALAGIAAWVMTSPSMAPELPPAQTSSLMLPSFTAPVGDVRSADSLMNFVNLNRGKLVEIKTQISPDLVRILDKIDEQVDLFVEEEQCPDEVSALECAGTHYLLSGSDHLAEYYNGSVRFIGYFVIDDIHWLHQGSYFRLRSIPREEVLLRTQIKPD